MKKHPDYLSEFEQEFELADEMDSSGQSYESDDQEYEWEEDTEMESDDEYEAEQDDELESWAPPVPRGSYGSRLYEAMYSGADNEFEMDREVDQILREMEQDYFFGAAKNWLKKKGLGLAKKFAQKLPIGGDLLSTLSSVARGDIRDALKRFMKSDLLKTGLAAIPGGAAIAQGLDLANQLSNSEMPARRNVEKAVAIGKRAYQYLAQELPAARTVAEANALGKAAVRRSVRDYSNAGQQNNPGMRRIPLRPGAVVTVHADHLIIRQP